MSSTTQTLSDSFGQEVGKFRIIKNLEGAARWYLANGGGMEAV